MPLASINNGTVNHTLHVDVHFDINDQLHNAFTVRYSNETKENILHDIANVPSICLQSKQVFEVWQDVLASPAQQGDWQLYQNDEYLIASMPNNMLANLPIDQACEKAYSMILQQLQAWDYPYLLRTWNFFADITEDGYGANNNYQLFCSGRARAYALHQLATQAYPAATVIGTQQAGLQIYFIASKSPGIGIENSKQVSAFDYPASYSEDPPLFSRALLHRNQSQQILFISGTASITGHDTQFEGDVNRQTEVCLDNIQHLLNTTIHEHQFTPISLSDFSQFKVFIKDSSHLDTVRTHLQSYLGAHTPIVYLQGDMCRADLLVEIEALAMTSTP